MHWIRALLERPRLVMTVGFLWVTSGVLEATGAGGSVQTLTIAGTQITVETDEDGDGTGGLLDQTVPVAGDGDAADAAATAGPPRRQRARGVFETGRIPDAFEHVEAGAAHVAGNQVGMARLPADPGRGVRSRIAWTLVGFRLDDPPDLRGATPGTCAHGAGHQ